MAAEELVLHGGYVPEPVVLRLCMVYGPQAKGDREGTGKTEDGRLKTEDGGRGVEEGRRRTED